MPDDDLRILACQITIPPTATQDARDAHLLATRKKVEAALEAKPADLVVLPELASIDYSRESFDRLDILAETLDGPSYETWKELARRHKCHVVYSFPRKDTSGYFITVAVVSPDGRCLGHYDKIHLAQFGASMEKEYYQRGDGVFVVDVKGFTISPIICYDIRIPELSRSLCVDHKVDLILHCGAYYRDVSFATWHDFAVTRAVENQVYFLSLNRAGDHYGNSLFCLPWMDDGTPPEGFAAHDEDLRHLVVRKSELLRVRDTFSFLADRRESYR